MPRQVPQETRQKWIELADKGLSPPEINRSMGTKSDLRTIENAINRERADRASSEIRSKAYVLALTEHWAILLASLDKLIESLDRPGVQFGGKPPVYALAASELQSPSWTAKRTPGGSEWDVTFRDVDTVEAQSLREHTGDTSLWRAVGSYAKSLEAFIKARLTLAKAIVSSMEHITGLQVKAKGDNRLDPVGLSEIDGALYSVAVNGSQSFEKLESSLRWERDNSWLVLNGKSLIETTSALPLDLPARIKGHLDKLRGQMEWRDLVARTTALYKASSNLQQEHALMKTMPALPGTCDACRRIS